MKIRNEVNLTVIGNLRFSKICPIDQLYSLNTQTDLKEKKYTLKLDRMHWNAFEVSSK